MATSLGVVSPNTGMIAQPVPNPYAGRKPLDKYKAFGLDFSSADGGGMNAAVKQALQLSGYGPDVLAELDRHSSYMSTLPPAVLQEEINDRSRDPRAQTSPALSAALADVNKRYQLQRFGAGKGEAGRTRTMVLFDRATGQPAAPGGAPAATYSRSRWTDAPLDAAKLAAATAGLYFGASAAGFGSAGGVGGTGIGAAGAATGAGEAAAIGASGLGSNSVNAALIESASGAAGYGGSGLGTAASNAAAASGGLASTASGYAPATNAALAESAVNTAGYGASSAGAGGGTGTLSSGGGWLSQIGERVSSGWNKLSPAQQLQLGGQLGSAAIGGLSGLGGGSSGAGGGGAGAGGAGGATTAQTNQFNTIIERMLAEQQVNQQRGNDVWEQYRSTYMPAMRRMADTAANFDTAGRREAAGAEAVAGVDAQFARQQLAQQQDIGLRGGTMDSGNAMALDSARRFSQARASAGADRVARQGIEDRGIALTSQVAGMGVPVASLGNSTSSLGLSAGNMAGNTLQGQLSAQDAATRTRLGLDSARNNDRAQDAAGWGSLLGTLGGLYFGGAKP